MWEIDCSRDADVPLKWGYKRLPVIDPDSWGHRIWSVLLLILVLYNAILVPCELGERAGTLASRVDISTIPGRDSLGA